MNKSTKSKSAPALETEDYTAVSLKNASNSIRTAIMQLAYYSNPELIIMAAEILGAWNLIEDCYSADKEIQDIREGLDNAL